MKSTVWGLGLLLATASLAGCASKDSEPAARGNSAAAAFDASPASRARSIDAMSARLSNDLARAAPSSVAPQPPAVDIAGYRKAVSRGRRLVRSGKYRKAVASFQAALRKRPDDSVALSELSWAAFKGGDLSRSIAAARRSISLGFGNIKAASLYNLGRALEQQGDVAKATAAYSTSLDLRPHRAVAARLEALTGTKIGNERNAVLMRGPHADFVTMCTSAGHDRPTCTKTAARTDSSVATKAISPLLDAFMFNGMGAGCVVAVRVRRGWYHLPVDTAQCLGNRYWRTAVHEFGIVPRGASGAGVAQFRYTETGRDFDSADRTKGMKVVSEEEYATVCGVGASGAPSCANVQIRVVDKNAQQRRMSTYRLETGPSIKLTTRGKTVSHTVVFP